MNNRKLINLLAYVAVILIAVATVFGYLSLKVFNFNDVVADICHKISFYIACIVTLFCAFHYASSKRNTTYMFLLIIAFIVLVLFMFII